MQDSPSLIVMLTHDDMTVENADEIFEKCKKSPVQYWGFKEKGLPLSQMKELFHKIKECGKTAVLEVVAYTEAECTEGALIAAECGCDILMGTFFFDSVNSICKENGIKYMPFVGDICGRPSILSGNIDDMIVKAKEYISKGAYGIDLLAYRYSGNCSELIRRFIKEVDAPVCVAGSVNSFERLDEIKEAAPWAYTVGSAFFDSSFGEGFPAQIDAVTEYTKEHNYA